MRLYLFIIATFSVMTACSGGPEKSQITKANAAALEPVVIMTYNVENLFDTVNDPKKQDETFLPLSEKQNAEIQKSCESLTRNSWVRTCLNLDWNEQTLALKMDRLTDVLKQVNGGKGPDVLLLQEVENKEVLENWRQNYLKDFGYQEAHLVEGADKRGIDVAVLTRLELAQPLQLHPMRPLEGSYTPAAAKRALGRGLLESTLKLKDGRLLTIITAHLPAQGAPTFLRQQTLEQINALSKTFPEDRLVVVGGDFNITSSEDKQYEYYSELSKEWGVSHKMGCEDCRGTYYYHPERQWSFFDVLLFSKSLQSGQSGWKVDPTKIRIEKKSTYQVNRWGSPSRFSPQNGQGVSDHWPMVAELIPMASETEKKATLKK